MTEVDVETGALNVRKQEAWINTFTPELTYVMRCNTDVTSLSSGTAIKAVVLYISNYITKSSLKTHVVFEVICDIFAKSSDVLQSHLPEKEKARWLVGKIVNLLAVKLELGAPMLAMYLLGHPDHYTDHKFIPFYWKTFVNDVRNYWTLPDEEPEGSDNVIIIRQGSNLHGFSPVMDYTLRNQQLVNLSLYDWVRQCKRIPKCKTKKNKDVEESSLETIKDPEDALDVDCPSQAGKIPKNSYVFLDGHTFQKTHHLQMRKDDEFLIPNFIGGTLPRHDSGDHEYYCCVMLTLFRPWRSGADLKKPEENWHEAFSSYEFTDHQKQLMNNLNLRYECLDERDDFHAQMWKNDGSTLIVPRWDEEVAKEMGDDYFPTVHPKSGDFDEAIEVALAKQEHTDLLHLQQMKDMRDILRGAHWTHEGINVEKITPLSQPDRMLSGGQWASEVQKKKDEVIAQRMKSLPESQEKDKQNNSFKPNEVKVVDKRYLEKQFHSPEFKATVDATSSDFNLNAEQDRAFRIVANHAISPYSDQL